MLRKTEPFKESYVWTGTLHQKVGAVEYQMPKSFADAILKQRKPGEKNIRPQDYLVQLVNNEFGLKNHCVKVTIVE